MSNPDRLQREAQDHAEALIEDRGMTNARAWAVHCALRDTGGFWSRVLLEIDRQTAAKIFAAARAERAKARAAMKGPCCDDCGEELDEGHDGMVCDRCLEAESDPDADRGDWEFHRDHDQ
jgi:hypothetical protein